MTRETVKDKSHFLVIARSSVAELRTQIYIGIEIGYLSSNNANAWLLETQEISAMLTGLRKSLHNNLDK